MNEQLIQWVVMPALSVAVVVCFVRLYRGPSLADRVVAMDQLMLLGLGFVSAYAVWHNEPLILDVAVLMALIVFLGTVAFARYLEKRAD